MLKPLPETTNSACTTDQRDPRLAAMRRRLAVDNLRRKREMSASSPGRDRSGADWAYGHEDARGAVTQDWQRGVVEQAVVLRGLGQPPGAGEASLRGKAGLAGWCECGVLLLVDDDLVVALAVVGGHGSRRVAAAWNDGRVVECSVGTWFLDRSVSTRSSSAVWQRQHVHSGGQRARRRAY